MQNEKMIIHNENGMRKTCRLSIWETALTPKMHLTVGIYAAKALVQHLCERFNNPDNVQVFIFSV
jgi:hypothetical protein